MKIKPPFKITRRRIYDGVRYTIHCLTGRYHTRNYNLIATWYSPINQRTGRYSDICQPMQTWMDKIV